MSSLKRSGCKRLGARRSLLWVWEMEGGEAPVSLISARVLVNEKGAHSEHAIEPDILF